MNNFVNFRQLFLILVIYFVISPLNAGRAPWTFSPLVRTTFSMLPVPASRQTVHYVITNQSPRRHTLVMTPIPGIRQDTNRTVNSCGNPFTLAFLQSCILDLEVSGIGLIGDVIGGPFVCDWGNALECYQPNPDGILRITRIPI